MDLKEYKRLAYSEEARKIMMEIKEKAKNSETHIEALKLIEQHMSEISPYAFFIAKDLSTSENQEIREKAKDILKTYYEQNPQYKEWEKKVDTFNKYWNEKIDELRSLWPQKIESPKLDALKEIPIEESKYATIKALLYEILSELEELKKRNEIDEEESKKLKKIFEELDGDTGKAYQ